MEGRTLRRYLAFQAPGWLVAILLAIVAARWAGVPWAVGLPLALAWIVKDLLLYPMLREAYRPPAPAEERMVGRTAVALGPLRGAGRVRIGAEVWSAEAAPGASDVGDGEVVRVVAVRGLTVIVEPQATTRSSNRMPSSSSSSRTGS